MRILLAVAGLLATALQDPAALIEQLQADDIEVREKAYAELLKLGASVEQPLKKVADGSDVVAATQARRLLRVIELDRLFSPALKKALPEASARIVLDDRQWTEAYLRVARATESKEDPDPFPGLKRSDLEPLAAPAFRHGTSDERKEVIRAAANWCHRSVVPEVLALFKDPEFLKRVAEEYDHHTYLGALVSLEGRAILDVFVKASHVPFYFPSEEFDPIELEPVILAQLRQPKRENTPWLLGWLAGLQSRETLSMLESFLEDPDPWTRKSALELLLKRSGRRHADRLIRALWDPDTSLQYGVRTSAAWLVINRRQKIPVDPVAAWARDSNAGSRWVAMKLTELVDSPDRFDVLRAGLKDKEADVRRHALYRLREEKRPEDLVFVTPLLEDPDAETRAVAVGLWGVLSGADAGRSLRQRVMDDHLEATVRHAAFDALVELRIPPSADDLSRLVETAPLDLAVSAATALAGSAPDRLTPILIERLVIHAEGGNGKAVADLLVKAATEAARDGLVRMLDVEDYHARLQAGRNLELMGRARMAESLMKRLKQPGTGGARMAVQVLANWKWEAAREDIAGLLDDKDDLLKAAAIDALGRIGPGSFTPKIRAQIGRNSWLTSEASSLLAQVRDVDSIPALRQALGSEKPSSTVLKALFDLGDHAYLKSLDLWKKEEWFEEAVVVRPPGILESLVALLESRDAEKRIKAAQFIGQWGDARVAYRLLPLLAEQDTAPAAVDSIVSLEARQVIPDLVVRLGNGNGTERSAALLALAGLRADLPAATLLTLTADSDVVVRKAALRAAAASMKTEVATEALRRLSDKAHTVRVAAVEAVETLKPAGADKFLAPLLDDPSERVRSAARRALLALSPGTLADEAVRRLRDPLENEREIYLDLLSPLKAKRVTADLIRLLDDRDLRHQACRVLGDLGLVDGIPEIRKRPNLGPSAARALWSLGDPAPLIANLTSEIGWEANEAICHLLENGDRRAVPVILSRIERTLGKSFPHEWLDRPDFDLELYFAESLGERLPLLNCVRNPEAWRRFTRAPQAARTQGRMERVMSALAASAGFRLEWEDCETFDHVEERNSFRRIEPGEAGRSLKSQWDAFFSDHSSWSYVLESDSIRIIPRRSALKFWEKWWADEQKKQKK